GGLPAPSRGKRTRKLVTVTDLVRRDFRRTGPGQLWVTDITEHPTREGKVYCCVVSMPGRGAWWAGRPTRRSEPAWRPTRCAWPSTPAAQPRAGSSTATTPPSSPHGRSPSGPAKPGCCPRWAASAPTTTTPSQNRSGTGCSPSCSPGSGGTPASNWPTRSSNTSNASTTATELAQRQQGVVADHAAGPGPQRGQPGDQLRRGLPGEPGADVVRPCDDQGSGLVDRLGPLRPGAAPGAHPPPDPLRPAAPATRRSRCAARQARPPGADRVQRVGLPPAVAVLPV